MHVEDSGPLCRFFEPVVLLIMVIGVDRRKERKREDRYAHYVGCASRCAVEVADVVVWWIGQSAVWIEAIQFYFPKT